MSPLRIPLFLAFLLIFFLLSANHFQVQAQEAAVDGSTAVSSGGTVFRLGMWEMLHQTFWTEEDHPYYQMTGSNRFRGGKGYQGVPSFDVTDVYFPDGLSANVNEKRYFDGDGHSQVDSSVGKLMDKLPTFSLEYIVPTDYLVAAGVSFHYTSIWLNDTKIRAATTGPDPSWDTPLLRTFTRFFFLTGNLYLNGPPRPGEVDYFWGMGIGRVESTYRWGIRSNPEIIYDYPNESLNDQSEFKFSSGYLFPVQRFGLASAGENFGFMLEFFRIPEDLVYDNPFRDQTFISKEAYNATYNDRGSILPERASMRGMITRATWTYSFW